MLPLQVRDATLALYFFHLHNGGTTFDTNGTDLSGVRDAKRLMLRKGMSLVESSDIIPKHGWHMEVLDEAGRIVCSMHFGEHVDD